MDTTVLFKNRSITACMKASYDLISDNFTSLLKKTWWAVLIYAFFTALTLYFRIPNKALHDWGVNSPMASFILQTLIYSALFLSSFLPGAALWTWINKKGFAKNLLHFSVLSLLCQVFSLLLIIGALPFAHVIPAYMLKEKGEKLSPWQAYKQGLRHIGSLFSMGFLSCIMLLTLSFILIIPTLILAWAQVSSQLGALNGDPTGVPGYFSILLMVTLVATLFVLIYLCAWMYISYAYLYGAHQVQHKHEMSINIKNIEQ